MGVNLATTSQLAAGWIGAAVQVSEKTEKSAVARLNANDDTVQGVVPADVILNARLAGGAGRGGGERRRPGHRPASTQGSAELSAESPKKRRGLAVAPEPEGDRQARHAGSAGANSWTVKPLADGTEQPLSPTPPAYVGRPATRCCPPGRSRWIVLPGGEARLNAVSASATTPRLVDFGHRPTDLRPGLGHAVPIEPRRRCRGRTGSSAGRRSQPARDPRARARDGRPHAEDGGPEDGRAHAVRAGSHVEQMPQIALPVHGKPSNQLCRSDPPVARRGPGGRWNEPRVIAPATRPWCTVRTDRRRVE